MWISGYISEEIDRLLQENNQKNSALAFKQIEKKAKKQINAFHLCISLRMLWMVVDILAYLILA